jgi:hypothetical protein
MRLRHEFPLWSWAGWQGPVIFPFKVVESIENQGHRIIVVRCGEDEHGSYFEENEKIRVLGHSPGDKGPVKLRTFVRKLRFSDLGPSNVGQEEDDSTYEHHGFGQEVLAMSMIRDRTCFDSVMATM